MKTKNLLLGAAVMILGFTACKSDEEREAERTVETYTVYVDSIGNIAEADARSNWSAIEADYERRTREAEAALANMKDREKAQERLDASRKRYEDMRNRYRASMEAETATTTSTTTTTNTGGGSRVAAQLFPSGSLGNDMNFSWVNKDNILKVYNDFNNAYDKNKDSYTREDFDEIKAMYEALDARKNTVEKEGLSSSDNVKIAELKFKFGPKFKKDRMGAKTSENEKAKDAAN